MDRTCNECQFCESWTEYGQLHCECCHPVAGEQEATSWLLDHSTEPARFCGYYKLNTGDLLSPTEAWRLKRIKEEAKEYTTGRWDYVDVCMTSKDADLEAGGCQGYDIAVLKGPALLCRVKAYMTIVGNEVTLNTAEGLPESYYEAKREQYLDDAYGAVCDFPGNGEWDGDSWGLKFEDVFTASVWVKDDGCIDFERTFKGLYDNAQAALAAWDRECVGLHLLLDQLAGWRNYNEKRLPWVGYMQPPAVRMTPYV